MDFSSISNGFENSVSADFIDLKDYFEIVKWHSLEWKDLFLHNISTIVNLQEQAIHSYQRLSNHLVISHRDLLQKNVLWNTVDTPMIIDWESAGYINPGLELIDVSLFWSGGHKGLPDLQAFNSLIESYIKNGGNFADDMNDILNARFIGKLEWLAYNMKRSLGIECNDDGDQKMRSNRVVKAIVSILHYHEIIPTLIEWLNKGKRFFS